MADETRGGRRRGEELGGGSIEGDGSETRKMSSIASQETSGLEDENEAAHRRLVHLEKLERRRSSNRKCAQRRRLMEQEQIKGLEDNIGFLTQRNRQLKHDQQSLERILQIVLRRVEDETRNLQSYEEKPSALVHSGKDECSATSENQTCSFTKGAIPLWGDNPPAFYAQLQHATLVHASKIESSTVTRVENNDSYSNLPKPLQVEGSDPWPRECDKAENQVDSILSFEPRHFHDNFPYLPIALPVGSSSAASINLHGSLKDDTGKSYASRSSTQGRRSTGKDCEYNLDTGSSSNFSLDSKKRARAPLPTVALPSGGGKLQEEVKSSSATFFNRDDNDGRNAMIFDRTTREHVQNVVIQGVPRANATTYMGRGYQEGGEKYFSYPAQHESVRKVAPDVNRTTDKERSIGTGAQGLAQMVSRALPRATQMSHEFFDDDDEDSSCSSGDLDRYLAIDEEKS